MDAEGNSRPGGGTRVSVHAPEQLILRANTHPIITRVSGSKAPLTLLLPGALTDGFLSLAVAPSARPLIGVSAVVSGNTFGFDFSAPPGASYTIESSTDLQNWTFAASGIVPPSGIVTFSGPGPASAAGRFYRIQLQ